VAEAKGESIVYRKAISLFLFMGVFLSLLLAACTDFTDRLVEMAETLDAIVEPTLSTLQPVPPTAEYGATLEPGVLLGLDRDLWEVYFTNPGENENFIAANLIELINNAKYRIHIASFEFDLDEVAEALLAAHARGVEVIWVTDDEHGWEADDEPGHGQFTMLLDAGIEVVIDDRAGLMHNKFWIFDDQIVWTGSTNITKNGTLRNNNNVIIIKSAELAAIYEQEFQEMLSGLFGVRSPSPIEDQFIMVGETPILIFFAAEDDVAPAYVRLIESAEIQIRFMAFSFTHDDIGAAVLERAKAGIDTAGIFEARGSETEYSELTSLFCNGVMVRQDGNPYAFHHKVFIIDESIVVTGSYNFSANADERNDENVLIIYDPAIAELYLEEFDRRWAEATVPVAGDDVTCQ
jgi:phosphatidylserine/phosphatidylglycerophosphate/cardiolipin synthase-like enzyme